MMELEDLANDYVFNKCTVSNFQSELIKQSFIDGYHTGIYKKESENQTMAELLKESADRFDELNFNLKNERDYSAILNDKIRALESDNEKLINEISNLKINDAWISVENRLPEPNIDYNSKYIQIQCLAYSKSIGMKILYYNFSYGVWDGEDGDDYYCDAIGQKVTHWKPLHKPPFT